MVKKRLQKFCLEQIADIKKESFLNSLFTVIISKFVFQFFLSLLDQGAGDKQGGKDQGKEQDEDKGGQSAQRQ